MTKYIAPNSLLPFFLDHKFQFNANKNRYNLCFSYWLESENQVSYLISRLQELVKLKPHLRQTFTLVGDKVVARIHNKLPPIIHHVTSSIFELDRLETALISQPHDLEKKSAIQLNIIKISDNNAYMALFNIHHILIDGSSFEQFITDLNQLLNGQRVAAESAKIYLSRVKKEVALQEKNVLPNITEYLEQVQNIKNNMEYVNNHNTKTHVLYFTQELPNSIKLKLINANKSYELSLFNLLLLAWSVFVIKLFNTKTALINYPVNIRNDKSIPGCFINTVVFPLSLKQEDTYSTLINNFCKKSSFYKKIAKASLMGHLDVGPISSFANSDFAKPGNLVINNKPLISKGYPQIANSNLSIKYKLFDEALWFSMDCLTEIMPDYVSCTLLPRFFNFLDKLLDNPKQLISQVDLTFCREKKRVLSEFNKTFQPYPSEKTIIDLFEDQVQKTPERTALVYENVKLSYQELNEKANQLAHYLTSYHHIKPDDLIALLLERSELTLIAILGVLKTGGAYVPLDFSYPPERIEYILEDTQVKMILINENHLDKLIPHLGYRDYEPNSSLGKVDFIVIDSEKIKGDFAALDKSNLITADTSANLAYVIYTSGTTGKPKGVMIEHKSVINTLKALNQVYKQKDEYSNIPLKITAFTSYAFDVSVSEFFVPLIHGNELHILSNTLRKDILATSKYINDNQINYVYLPPVLLAQLPRIKYPTLKGIIYAGEPCDAETARYWSNKTKLFNYYGPTEAAIYATGLEILKDEVHLIGKPIANTTIYVLNAEKKPQPIGVIGELYIGGQGLAKGYLNQRELTQERFIPNPFQTDNEKIQGFNSRLYKTGDLVRWCPDGNLEYLGRYDFQVKIRGFRIELGEIENALTSYPEIKQAVVLVKNLYDAKKSLTCRNFLVGYYKADVKINDHKILEYLSLHLPDYMQPNALVHLTEFPVTINGKLDRNALPTPELIRTDNYIAPTNDKEHLICDRFARILNLEKVGIEDDFFKLGGNSIMAISLVASLQASFDMNVMDIFNLKTPKKIARDIPFIKNNLKKGLEKIRLNYHLQANRVYNKAPFQSKLDSYFYAINQLEPTFEKAPINYVLLTGATGFLGANLLKSLLVETDYSVFLIIRAESDKEAYERVNKKFKFYFDEDLYTVYNKRLFVYAGDLEEKNLGLSNETYQTLITQIDSIIHSAALTKHYGEYDTFYLANVQATSHLLELSMLTTLKYFHYISTISILNEGYVPNCEHYIFTEDDVGDNLEDRSNIYVKTKYEGEKIVIKYRKLGVKGSIYRVGNLAFMESNQRAQENIEENGFFTRLSCLLALKIVAPEIASEEISPVDSTAKAIIKLFDKEALSNSIFHVFNPNSVDLSKLLSEDKRFDTKLVTIDQFIISIINKLNNPKYKKIIELFLLHMRWLNEHHRYSTNIQILQSRTETILERLGFEWTVVSKKALKNYVIREIEHAK